MPELPDIVVYIESLERHLVGKALQKIRIHSPFLLRNVEPPLEEFEGRIVQRFRRLGKRIVFQFEGELFLILHLMIAGRLQWKSVRPAGRMGLACFDFDGGTLILTEAGTKRRASLHTARAETQLLEHQPGGLEIFDSTVEDFTRALRSSNHTVKRSLTNPRIFSGIGNAYSDEILHHAMLSPLTWTSLLTDAECERLFQSTQAVMQRFLSKLRQEVGDGFPTKVTAFRPDMAVHGRFKLPCPKCGTPVQRIVYSENETNYCPECQTQGKVLADRALSKLLKDDWPRSVEEWEEIRKPKLP
ncbi:hypothetical protein KIH39_05470 [Telmatocola sphagniphila]|uniref:DNA-(apurinic or apyrimidinic site) lyase n=1 Tax=Telmatocola sphagniphila TaxID=1123043 RepID=A0A8E6BA46_9BACT|nr:DNA-formamidopyrimidine glycosylase family protein [Telmatocola sphagniphila]QVL33363.1 hypothetical protein KIH39_05470 [Telmatocola sphagniphila]